MTDILDDAALGTGVRPSFQQVVSLPGGTVVGYEALARWPHLDGAGPLEVFAHAARTGTLDALDSECIRRAAHGALEGSSTPGMLLLINCEPTTAHPDLADGALAAAADTFHLMFELTERGLLDNPRALLRKVDALRSRGFMIALDDIGAERDSLALLDIISPEILKLDMGLVQNQPDDIQARTVAAIIGHHERTGATILAEGIETDLHLEQALAYGATLGQGYLFGHPGALSTVPDVRALPSWAPRAPEPTGRSVFDLATPGLAVRTVRKQTLHELCRHIERLALTADSTPIVLATVQNDRYFDGATLDMYTQIAQRSPLVVVFGEDVPAEPEPGIRGVSLSPSDPLSSEWTVLVLGPDTAAALIAREQPDGHPHLDDGDRRFESVITFDRDRVAAAARSLLARLPDGAAG
ncbi:EAL domain-containing protein [Mycolicibacterium rufum]|uniref:EAL domain-containing protein n=1 Tax=Mycolicibacterium rufum TaxID=318424 RepID=A0A9X2YHT5_9MYCO|nr:EAL domain-containing protein [Mycolicibacterium rufum]KGI67282.1 diguanylate phosphodiesterase [Mycolicibacterium rufum]MCV7073500.1 EAL domain-containing protein [Mycolicibacterium rufum]ULP38191.1 EAL domain-containing protein [Mycolicibacterium rufum]